MRITASNSKILSDIYRDLKDKNIEIEKITKDVEGAKGDVVTYLSIASLGVSSLGTLFTYLRYLESQKNHYIHYRYKEDAEAEVRELKFANLSQKEVDKKLKNIQDNLDKLELIDIG